jgi:hypothetical protein
MNDWADEKARGWLRVWLPEAHERSRTAESLAALLREVQSTASETAWIATREQTLAEVRRVVEEVKGPGGMYGTLPGDRACDMILSRLEKL